LDPLLETGNDEEAVEENKEAFGNNGGEG